MQCLLPDTSTISLLHVHLNKLTLSQTTNFRHFQNERGCRRKFKFDENRRNFSKRVENTVEKEKLLVTSNFSFSHSVFKILVLQTRKKPRLVWERVNLLPDDKILTGLH